MQFSFRKRSHIVLLVQELGKFLSVEKTTTQSLWWADMVAHDPLSPGGRGVHVEPKALNQPKNTNGDSNSWLASDNGLRTAGNNNSPDKTDKLLCEGYLRKIRGWGQNRTRWFRLTTSQFEFYSKDAGDLLAYCAVEDIASVTDLGGLRFQVETKKPFGRTSNQTMMLEASTSIVKQKWINNLKKKPAGVMVEPNTQEENALLIEGYITKLQASLAARSRTRWFVLTTKLFAYYEHEGGPQMAACELNDLEKVTGLNTKCFQVVAKQPFTKSGADTVTLQCYDGEERDKWLQYFKQALPGRVTFTPYTSLPTGGREDHDHYGVVVDQNDSQRYLEQQVKDMDHSQGNRFIHNDDL
eukprot:m.52012 g.52012  ORF g.52012 m.52012 type:complete len:355 (-) comp10767_c0_seq1:227-1291(-)